MLKKAVSIIAAVTLMLSLAACSSQSQGEERPSNHKEKRPSNHKEKRPSNRKAKQLKC